MEPDSYSLAILAGLQKKVNTRVQGCEVRLYEGTVPYQTVQDRRAANRRARRSRRTNRVRTR